VKAATSGGPAPYKPLAPEAPNPSLFLWEALLPVNVALPRKRLRRRAEGWVVSSLAGLGCLGGAH